MFCTNIVLNVNTKNKNKNNYCTQHDVNLYFLGNSMNNLLSYCGLTEASMRASEKDLPVESPGQKIYYQIFITLFKSIRGFQKVAIGKKNHKKIWSNFPIQLKKSNFEPFCSLKNQCCVTEKLVNKLKFLIF